MTPPTGVQVDRPEATESLVKAFHDQAEKESLQRWETAWIHDVTPFQFVEVVRDLLNQFPRTGQPEVLSLLRKFIDFEENKVTLADFLPAGSKTADNEVRHAGVTLARKISAEEPGAAMIDAETIHTRDTDTAWTQQAWETRRVDPLLRPFLGWYIAVFEAQVVAHGLSREDVRNKAFQAMNGTVPSERFVIDYWDDEE